MSVPAKKSKKISIGKKGDIGQFVVEDLCGAMIFLVIAMMMRVGGKNFQNSVGVKSA